MIRINSETISCNKNEIIDLMEVITALDKLTLKDIENLINTSKIEIYNKRYGCGLWGGQEPYVFTKRYYKILIEPKECTSILNPDRTCIHIYEASQNTYFFVEEIPLYGYSTHYYSIKNDIEELLKNHPEYTSKALEENKSVNIQHNESIPDKKRIIADEVDCRKNNIIIDCTDINGKTLEFIKDWLTNSGYSKEVIAYVLTEKTTATKTEIGKCLADTNIEDKGYRRLVDTLLENAKRFNIVLH